MSFFTYRQFILEQNLLGCELLKSYCRQKCIKKTSLYYSLIINTCLYPVFIFLKIELVYWTRQIRFSTEVLKLNTYFSMKGQTNILRLWFKYHYCFWSSQCVLLAGLDWWITVVFSFYARKCCVLISSQFRWIIFYSSWDTNVGHSYYHLVGLF